MDEVKAALFLIEQGLNVKFLKANRTAGSKTPDFLLNNLRYELKTPRKSGKYTMEHAIRAGLRQSNNLVFDLRRMRASEANAVKKLLKQFDLTKKWKRLLVISKDGKLLTYEK